MPEPGTGELITNAAPGAVGTHDVIIHALDTWRPYQIGNGIVETRFYPADIFRGTEDSWQTVPVILGEKHPATPYQVNPDKALAESKGTVVGNLSDVVISETGSKLLKSKIHLTDSNAEDLLKAGKLALSSGFISGKTSDGILTGINGRVVPDHVLVFPHDKMRRPQDGAALVLNSTSEAAMPENENIKGVLSEFLSELKTLLIPARAEQMMPAKPEFQETMVPNMTETKIAELEKVNAEQAELIKNMSAELEGFKKADEERKLAEVEAEWQMVKNSIAPGLIATPELEKTARAEWEVKPSAFLIKNAIQVKSEETPKEGVEFVKNASGNSQAEADAEYLKFLNGDE